MKDEKFDFKKIVSENWMEPPKRERKRKYVSSILEIMHSSNVCSVDMNLYFLSVTLNQNTSSRQCVKVVLQDLKSLEFPACLSCKHLAFIMFIDFIHELFFKFDKVG